MAVALDTRDVILKKLKNDRDRNIHLHPTPPNRPIRTLLLLGPTRAGKSTVAKVLADSVYEPPKPQLYSTTREPELQQVGGLRIIDMPGFYDRQTYSSDFSLTNRSILTMLNEQLRKNDPVHLFAFVFSLANGINNEDIETMHLVQENLPHLTEKMMLLVTHAEEMDDEFKYQLEEDFFQHPKVIQYNLRSFFKKGVLFVGSLRYESLLYNDHQALTTEHQNVLAMRKIFIKKCFEEDLSYRDNVTDRMYEEDDIDYVEHKRSVKNHSNIYSYIGKALVMGLCIFTIFISLFFMIHRAGLFPIMVDQNKTNTMALISDVNCGNSDRQASVQMDESTILHFIKVQNEMKEEIAYLRKRVEELESLVFKNITDQTNKSRNVDENLPEMNVNQTHSEDELQSIDNTQLESDMTKADSTEKSEELVSSPRSSDEDKNENNGEVQSETSASFSFYDTFTWIKQSFG